MSESASDTGAAVPGNWVASCLLRNGRSLLIRPIRAEDESLMASFVANISAESARNRFHFRRGQLTASEIHRFTHIDYRREMAFVAIVSVSGQDVEVGVSRYVMDEHENTAEFAILIADEWQHMGIGRVLLATLAAYATSAGLEVLHGVTYSSNEGMLKLARSLAFSVSCAHDEPSFSEMSKALC